MTLKLVAVEGEAVEDPTLAEELHDFADNLDSDIVGVVSIAIDTDGELRLSWFGEDYTVYHLMGLFEAAKLVALANSADD